VLTLPFGSFDEHDLLRSKLAELWVRAGRNELQRGNYLTLSRVAVDAGIPSSTLSSWATGKSLPRDPIQLAAVGATLARLAGEIAPDTLEWDGLLRLERRRRDRPAARSAGILEVAINVAAYVGSAGIGGILGGRTDAIFVATAKALFRSVHERWLKRSADNNETSLSEDEATDAAKAAAIAIDYNPASIRVVSAVQREDRSWSVKLVASRQDIPGTEHLRASVPGDDPARATILIYFG
jgi:hypothetical protein